MEAYYLLHGDKKIATFAVDGNSVLSFRANNDCRMAIPYGVKDARSFADWLSNRAIPITRWAKCNGRSS